MHQGHGHRTLSISRRSFLRSGTLAAAVVPAIPAAKLRAATPPAETSFAPHSDLLETVRSTAQWIQSAQKQDERRVWWLPDPDHPEKPATVSAPNAIYSGTAGTVLFFTQLAQATGNNEYLETAARGADYLAATCRDLVDKPGVGPLSGPGFNLAHYGGLSGLSFVLNETAKASGNAQYRDVARATTDFIAQAAKPAGSGLEWSGAPGVAGDGSIVLYLFYAAHEFQNDAYLQAAEKAGDRFLELAVKDPRGGLSWSGFPALPGVPKDAYFPNFEGGTAGAAYVLTLLYGETKKEKYLAAAREGALHLETIAAVHGDAALIPYRFPDLTDLYYLGFCHGPAGTVRTFFELHRVTGEKEYRTWTDRLAQGVIQSGIPENLTPGFWNVVCQCCGSAGVIDLFIGLWASTGRADYRAFAERVAGQLVSRTTNLDGKGDRWYQAWTRVKPWVVNAETGYSIGASGIGAALLYVYLAKQGQYRAILLPDNPFLAARA